MAGNNLTPTYPVRDSFLELEAVENNERNALLSYEHYVVARISAVFAQERVQCVLLSLSDQFADFPGPALLGRSSLEQLRCAT